MRDLNGAGFRQVEEPAAWTSVGIGGKQGFLRCLSEAELAAA